MTDLPVITHVDGRPRFLVDGQPFLILGLQWDCDSCFSAEEMNPLFAHAAAMGANTAVLPTYWREVEPEHGRFDFSMVDERIHQCRANGLRAVLLWFATWKNACAFYAPDWVRNDPATFRFAVMRDGQPTVSLCPTSEVTWQHDRDALTALMAHLRDVDDQRTVIMIQVENEPGVLGSDRCYCDECNAQYAAGEWEARYGVRAAEAFTAASIARFIDRLTGEAKAVYDLPCYANVALAAEIGSMPHEYFCGGAIPGMLPVWREQVRCLDMISPDIYRQGYRDFRELCQIYAADGNPLYIAETSSSRTGRAERNVFYAIGEHGALGFDPWAIDSPFPERFGAPMVDPAGGEWAEQAYWLRDSYLAIGRAVTPIVEAQGTPKLFTFVQEPGEHGARWAADGVDVIITYTDRNDAGRGLLIQRAPHEFLAIGAGFDVQFRHPRPSGKWGPIRHADWGRYEGDRWITLHPMRRERPESIGSPLKILEPGVARIILGE